jgi:hypothetical protein
MAAAAPADPSAGLVAGRVLGPRSTVPDARVYAYQVADLSLARVVTDDQGRFAFDALPAGLYKIIAHKAGFLPVVVVLTRASAEARQFLELQLLDSAGSAAAGGDFWSVREQIPADVLRDLDVADAPLVSVVEPMSSARATEGAGFQTEMVAMTGVDQVTQNTSGYVTSGRLGLRGKVGAVRVGVTGDFWQLDGAPLSGERRGEFSAGEASTLQVRVENADQEQFHLTSLSNRLNTLGGAPIELEHFRVSLSQRVGQVGRSNFNAQYTNESNFYREGWFNSLGVPDASRTWRVEGSYARPLGDRATLETGVRYRQRDGTFARAASFLPSELFAEPEETVGLFSRGTYEAHPAVLVEYGLYAAMLDGTVSVIPRGGVILQMGPHWQAATSVSHRVETGDESERIDFQPAFYSEAETAEQAEQYRYGVVVTRTLGPQGSISLGAVDRKLAESLRVYFSQRFFDHFQNLYLAPGDRLPELQLSVAQQITPSVMTKLESSYSAGGGGVVVAGGRRPFENAVSYLVTSLDTRYAPTATGVFVAFQRLEQELRPLRAGHSVARQAELESLELMLTQDLNVLLDLAAEWAVQLNMELSRGALPSSPVDDDEVRRRILGGVAVRF